MNKLATILLCINFITVLFPQPGYIHPDEFFQSTEIVAGDVLNVTHFRAWEFNESFPVRSVVPPYLMISPSLYFLRWINGTGIPGFQMSTVKVVMATRLPLAFLSLFGYLATGKLATVFNVDKYLSCVLYCSSYVSWTYFTRTFSNSVESVLLAIVLLLTCSNIDTQDAVRKLTKLKASESQHGSSKLDSKPAADENKIKTNSNSEKPTFRDTDTQPLKPLEAESDMKSFIKDKCIEDRESVEASESHEQISQSRAAELLTDNQKAECFPRAKIYSTTDSCFSKSFILGIIIVAGFFNRPTFLAFSFIPVLFWLCHSNNRMLFSLFFISLGASISFIIFVVLDTVYYNSDIINIIKTSSHFLASGDYSLQSFAASFKVFKSVLVITPWNFLKYNTNTKNLAEHGLHPRYTHLLVNLPLLLGPLYFLFLFLCILTTVKFIKRSQDNNMLWVVLMAAVPIISLSAFPHQEPRFLIPALPFFMVIGAKVLAGLSAGKFSLIALWTVFNIILTLVYGYMHQAALIPALSIYQQRLSTMQSSFGNHRVIFYKTYQPPRHLLLLNQPDSQISILDLAGAPISSLIEKIKAERNTCIQSKASCHVSVFLPSTITPLVLESLSKYKVTTTTICPHLSMEAPPRFKLWWEKRISFDEFIMDFCLNILKIS
ncbi:unnamed protein product [Lymnaea stagnalis]|uniref:Mannosyltransferase n=1 Tax=Lymnaea stagnalis TaxID=6523 RepID=A0AAV2I7V7_LYMST